MKVNTKNNEQGSISIFSVIIFIILVSIITVSFLRLVNTEQQLAIDNSSSDNALAAARSGVEEGKRVLLLAAQLPDSDPTKTELLSHVIGNTACNAVTGNATVQSQLGINSTGKIYSENGTDGQYLTCLTLQKNIDSYENTANPGASIIVPLKSSSPFTNIGLSWHRTATDGKLGVAMGSLLGNNPKYTTQQSKQLPSYMRVQLIRVPKTNITPTNITSQTLMLATGILAAPATVSAGFSDDTNLSAAHLAPTPVQCGTGLDYACNAILKPLGTPDTVNYDYYARVTALYSKASFRLTLLDAANTPQQFDGVQSIVDATGKSGDTYRRLRARVSFAPDIKIPEYTAESTGLNGGAGTICKDVLVNDGALLTTCSGW